METELPRPRRLDEILGQDRAIAVLRAALGAGRVHHAWIFAGPKGVGKRTTAEIFAGMLLDPTTGPNLAGEIEPDPASPTQALVASASHPDLHIITKELARHSSDAQARSSKLVTIPKAVIDERLLGPISLAPTMKTGSIASKVFIIDEAELMDRSRFHAPTQASILKTLEEPPPGSVIILVTSSEDRLLPTVRSRCQRVSFTPLDDAAMDAWFDRAMLDADAEERAWLAEFAAGSPGAALEAHETGLHAWSDRLEPLLAEAEQGGVSPELGKAMKELVDAWAKSWVSSHQNASKEAANRAGVRHLLALLGHRWRGALRDAAALGDAGEVERVARLIDLAQEAEGHVAANVNLTLAMEELAVGVGK